MKNWILTLVAAVALFNFGWTQGNQKVYSDDAKYYLDLHVGHAWHTSDVKNIQDRFPLGGGLTFAGMLPHRPASLFSMDIRLKFFGAKWYGQDTEVASSIENNVAVNNIYESLDMPIQNFRAFQIHGALELALHYNRLREMTGVDPYIFAGIGATYTRTRGDLLKETNIFGQGGMPYDYGEDPTASNLDGEYESFLDMNKDGKSYQDGRVEWLPSVGFGIGYRFNKTGWFGLGLEHTTTFFRNDYFDGTIVKQEGVKDKGNNDLYHYTSVYFRFYLKPKEKQKRPTPPPPEEEVYIDNPVRTPLPPIVNFTSPSHSPYNTDSKMYTLRANVQHVNSSNNITFRQNGGKNTAFVYNAMNNQFEAKVNLVEGQNTFTIEGVNQDGRDNDMMIINRERTQNNPPIVTIVDPGTSPYEVNQLNYTVQASIQNIDHKSQLEVRLNNQKITNFQFTPTGNVNFSANVNLKAGENTFRIVGTNQDGMDYDEAVLIYKRRPATGGTPPTVNITQPYTSPYTSNKNIEEVKALVKNVSSKNQIEVRVNGSKTNNFTYNSSTEMVSLQATLINGTNTIAIKGSNSFGTDDDTAIITYRKPVDQGNPPVVNITKPYKTPYTSSHNTEGVKALVKNVSSKNQVEVRVNGSLTDFTWDNSSSMVSLNVNLIGGNNTIQIRGTNNFGSDEATTVITRKKIGVAGNPPVVTITHPTQNPYSTNLNTVSVTAQVEQITGKSNVEVKVNNQSISFDYSNGKVTFKPILKEGNNTVMVKGTNMIGSDEDQMIIKYERPVLQPNPFVGYVNPATPNTTVSNKNYQMKASVKNVSSKADIEVYFNGAKVASSNYSYNAQKQELTYLSVLKNGKNTYQVKAKNSSGSAEASTTIHLKLKAIVGGTPVLPCDKPVLNVTNPLQSTVATEDENYVVKATFQHITKRSQVKVSLNGKNQTNFTLLNGIFSHNVKLKEGQNIYKITATNDCGSVSKTITFHYEKPETCGVEIDISGLNPEFCLNAGGAVGVIDANFLLANPTQSYSGTAKNLYFKAKKNGVAIVNGSEVQLIKGNYYHFMGNITVDIRKNRPGYNNQWSVCVEASRMPLFGNGKNKPDNPCITGQNQNVAPTPSKENKGNKTIINTKPKPTTQPKPTTKPNTEAKPNNSRTPISQPTPGRRGNDGNSNVSPNRRGGSGR